MSKIKCPECNEENTDIEEFFDTISSSEDVEISCGSCGDGFILIRKIKITYSAKKLEEFL